MVKTKSLFAKIPYELWLFLKKEAAKKETTVAMQVVKALEEYRDKIKNKY